MPNVVILKADDITPAEDIAVAASAGSESAQTELHVWYSKGTAGGVAKNLRLVAAAESKVTPGTLVYSGVPCLDRGWLKVRVSGTSNPSGAAGLIPQSTGWYPVSSGLPLTLFDLPGDCARKVFVKLSTPIDVGQASEDWNLYLVPTWEDVVTPMPLGLRSIGGGILSGVGDAFVTEPVTLATITPSDPADAVVHLTDVSFVVAGVEAVVASADVTLDQNAANGALTAGQSYIAAIAISSASGGTISTRKGNKATTGSADPPTLLGGTGLVCYVEVAYGAGGSVIEAGAITNATRDTRFKVVKTAALTVSVGPGRALLPGVFIDRRDVMSYAFTSTQYLFLLSDGTLAISYSPTVLPYDGALVLAGVTVVAGDITAIEDLRSVVRSPFNSTPFTLPGNVAIVDDVDFGGHAITNATGVLTTLDGADIDLDGHTISDGALSGVTLSGASLAGALDAVGERIANLPVPITASEGGDAVPLTYVRGLPVKSPVRCIADPEIVWPNVVTNGDFATDLTGWAGTGWAWDALGTALHTAGTADPLTQDLTIVTGVRYKLTCTVGGTVGSITPSIGAVAGAAIPFGSGVTEQIIIAGASGTLPLAFTPSSDFDGDIDDVFLTATLFGLPVIDDVTPNAGDRALLPSQADIAERGKWIVSDVAPWTRHPDCAAAYYLYAGCMVWVREGTGAANSLWVQTAVIADIETTEQTWVRVF